MNWGKAKPCRWVYELSGRFPVESGVQSRPILRWSHRHVSNDGIWIFGEYLGLLAFHVWINFLRTKEKKKVVKCKGMMQGGILGHFADCFECGVLFVCLFVCLFVGWFGFGPMVNAIRNYSRTYSWMERMDCCVVEALNYIKSDPSWS